MGAADDPLIRNVRNTRVAAARRLHRRQGRRASDGILLEGPHLIAEGVAAELTWQAIFYSEDWAATADVGLLAQVRRQTGPGKVFRVTADVLAALATTRTPQGIVAVATAPAAANLTDLAPMAPVVCLDGLQDPGNVGAVLRAAYALGAAGALIGTATADPYQPKVLRAGAGMMLHLPLVPTPDMPMALRRLQAVGRVVIGLTPQGGTPLPAVPWRRPGPVLVVGSEGHGISGAVLDCLDQPVTIPLRPGAESLNAAVAAAIALYEIGRTDFSG